MAKDPLDNKKAAIIDVDAIDTSDRKRQDYGDITKLAESISEHGLIHPPTVNQPDPSKDTYKLLAGGRRMKAIQELGWKAVPCNIYVGVMDNKRMRAVELEENIRRKNLSIREEAALTHEIHETYVEIKGKKQSTRPGAKGHSKRDTAEMLGKSPAQVTVDIELAKAFNDPVIGPYLEKCATKTEALKTLSKVKEQLVLEELSKRQEAKAVDTPEGERKQQLIAAYNLTDSYKFVQEKVPNESVDLIEADPDYGIDILGLKKGEGDGKAGKDYKQIKPGEFLEQMELYINEWYRVLKKDSWLVLWHAFEYQKQLYDICIEAGFKGRLVPGLWVKPTGQTNRPEMYMGSAAEPFLYLRKGNPILNKQGRSNVFEYRPVSPNSKRHDTERPIEMICDLLYTFVSHGVVFVPFLGSGNTLLAASNVTDSKFVNGNLTAYGCDLGKGFKDSFTVAVSKGVLGDFNSYRE